MTLRELAGEYCSYFTFILYALSQACDTQCYALPNDSGSA